MATKTTPADDAAETPPEEEKKPLNLTVKIDRKGACERHITVTVSEEDVSNYFSKALGELMPSAQVPGFRAGRAPKKLVEHRFHKEVAQQVKASLLMDSLEQISSEQKLAAISEPDLDMEAVEVPEEGPMTFEFNLEVRPEFDLPQWKGLTIDKPVREFSEKDIDAQLERVLTNHGKLVPFDGPATTGDYLTVNLTFRDGDEVVSQANDIVIRIRPVLSLRDGKIEKFDTLMNGVKAGETRSAEAKVSEEAPNEALRGKTVTASFEVLEVKKVNLPELTPDLLEQLGGFNSEADLRQALRGELERQLNYHQSQSTRQQVTALLTAAADWDLPPDLLRRQSSRELERSVLELRRSGFADDRIREHENELRQNSLRNTARALKEHFILERIAEEEKIEDVPEDYDAEVALIAAQSGESPRRVRAQLEKRSLMDVLRNQIIERKVIDLVLQHAQFNEIPFKMEKSDVEALDEAAGGNEEQIPEAQDDAGASLEAAKAEKKLS
ncbi:MAG TPA: trigger factor [Pirellulales bacterium]|jgi:trigger factor|nr:trigger factor [Pirellulales bacterium]